MSWEKHFFELFDDLEQQAEGMFQAERAAEVADRSRAEYGSVTLASRLMASLGTDVVLRIQGIGVLQGTVRRVAADWCLLVAGMQEWIVRLAAVDQVRGASDRSMAEAAWSPVAKLGFASVLRHLSEGHTSCLLCLVDGTRHETHILRVGQDFVEANIGANATALFPLSGIAAVQERV
jgi:hypothetical protein